MSNYLRPHRGSSPRPFIHTLIVCAGCITCVGCSAPSGGKEQPPAARGISGLDELESEAGAQTRGMDSLIEQQARAMEELKTSSRAADQTPASNPAALSAGVQAASTRDVVKPPATRERAYAANITQPAAGVVAEQQSIEQAQTAAAQDVWESGGAGLSDLAASSEHDITQAPPPQNNISQVTTLRRPPAVTGSRAAFAGEGPQPSPDDELADLAKRMSELLSRTNTDGKPAIPDAAALAPIEAMRPGVLATLEDPRGELASRLTPSQRKILIDARERLLAKPDALGDLKLSIKGLAPTGVRIDTAALCTRVTGFGKYQPFPTNRFLAGEPLRAIVYTEISNFDSRAKGDEQSVELSQSLSLFSNADDLLVWHSPAKSVVETSRNTRRDFYLIQQIELPRTLSVGRYNLKITLTDAVANTSAQRIVPIEVVAQ
jgi:hypothetical protein